MIQRIQSVFFLLASASFFGLFKLPFASSSDSTSPFFEDQVFNLYDHSILLALAIIGGLVSLVAIFLFKNRGFQKRMGYLGIIASLFLGLVAAWLVFSNRSDMTSSIEVTDQMGLYLPVVSLISIILANYFISKDEKLVKSMDRLR